MLRYLLPASTLSGNPNSMSWSIYLQASIPLVNPNRFPLARLSATRSVECFRAGYVTPYPDSATYTTKAAVGKLCSSVSVSPSIPLLLRHQPSPDLGLVFALFVLSTVFGAFVSLGLIAIPAIAALRRLEMSARRLEKVAAQEVPGTLLSLKLSSMEIGHMAKILTSVRHSLESRIEVRAFLSKKPTV